MRALITGVTGQDGAYLARLLLEKGYEVYGTYRRTSTPNFWRLRALDVFERVHLIPADVMDMSSLLEAVTISKPDEIYNLAAQSFVGASFETPLVTGDVDGLAATRLLEVIRLLNPRIRFYQASTSEVYGNVPQSALPIDEETPMRPASPYAAAKLYSLNVCRIYREAYGLFAANGILFNHESPLRGLEFVTRKVTNTAAQIAIGQKKQLALGNLEARRDWGHAEEYVEAMWLMLQAPEPDDYVVATGETHSIRELCQASFSPFGLNWEEHVVVDKRHLRPLDVRVLLGNPAKAAQKLGWKPKTKFADLIRLMAETDHDRWTRYLKGEIFPWDAPNYPGETTILTRTLRT